MVKGMNFQAVCRLAALVQQKCSISVHAVDNIRFYHSTWLDGRNSKTILLFGEVSHLVEQCLLQK